MRPYEILQIDESSSVEQQLRQIKSFLYRQTENLNYNLKNSDAVSLWRQTAEALSVSSNEEVEEMRRDEFQALRGLIIKSATSIVKNEDSFNAQLSGNYTAESDYGTFSEEGHIFINGNPYTIGQVYKYQAEIVTDVKKYQTELEGFIRTGVLERETSSPVFGMEIGYNKSTYVVDGKEIDNASPAKIRITPVKIGFYQGDNEVAYIQQSAVYFPAAHITGGTISIGNGNFTVDNQGNMTAKNALIYGTVNASAGIIGGFEITGESDMTNTFWPCSLSSVLAPTDEPNNRYAVFIRGFYNDSGTAFGAIDTTHNVFGIKKKDATYLGWDNEIAPYVYRVNVKGEVYCSYIKPEIIYADHFRVTENRIMLGNAGENDIAAYTKPIEMYTTDEVKIGFFAKKVKNIYLLAKENIRIGQHTDSSDAATDSEYPSTENVYIQAKTLFQVGTSGYPVYRAYFYANSTQFSGVVAPMTNEGADLGHSEYKWKSIYATTVNANYISGYVTIGKDVSDKFVGVTVGSNGHLTLCGLVGDNEYKQYTLQTIVQYMRTSRTKIDDHLSKVIAKDGNVTFKDIEIGTDEEGNVIKEDVSIFGLYLADALFASEIGSIKSRLNAAGI